MADVDDWSLQPPGEPLRPDETDAIGIIDPTVWTTPAPPREWIVPDWIPRGYATGLYGDGAVGKSLAAQQLLTCCATQQPWFGMDVAPCRTFGMFCEDDVSELWRRQDAINAGMRLRPADLANLKFAARLGADNLLMTFDPGGRGLTTPLLTSLELMLDKLLPGLIVIDTLTDIFAGDERNRSQARQFVQNVGGRLARRYNCGLVICGHPSQSGKQSGDGTAGSTQWNNTFRSRIYMSRPTGPDAATNQRVISRKKANYAPSEAEFAVEWADGMFWRDTSARPARAIPWPAIDLIFTDIDRAWLAGKPLSIYPQTRRAGRYLPDLAAARHGLAADSVRYFTEKWLATGYLEEAIADSRMKIKGLRVIKRLTQDGW